MLVPALHFFLFLPALTLEVCVVTPFHRRGRPRGYTVSPPSQLIKWQY